MVRLKRAIRMNRSSGASRIRSQIRPDLPSLSSFLHFSQVRSISLVRVVRMASSRVPPVAPFEWSMFTDHNRVRSNCSRLFFMSLQLPAHVVRISNVDSTKVLYSILSFLPCCQSENKSAGRHIKLTGDTGIQHHH